MTPLEKQVIIMKMLAAIKEAMGRLYETYASTFPEHEEFWFGLAMEEADHANWILELTQDLKKGSASIDEYMFKTEDIQKFRDYLMEQLGRARQEKITFNEALSIALDIERSPIEKEFFRIFEGGSEEYQHVLEYLALAVDDHTKILQQKLEQQENL